MWFVEALARRGHHVRACFTREGPGSYEGIRGRRVRRLSDVCDCRFGMQFGDDAFLELLSGPDSCDVLCHHAAEVTEYKRADFDVAAAVASNTRRVRDIVAKLEAGGGRLLCTGSVFEGGKVWAPPTPRAIFHRMVCPRPSAGRFAATSPTRQDCRSPNSSSPIRLGRLMSRVFASSNFSVGMDCAGEWLTSTSTYSSAKKRTHGKGFEQMTRYATAILTELLMTASSADAASIVIDDFDSGLQVLTAFAPGPSTATGQAPGAMIGGECDVSLTITSSTGRFHGNRRLGGGAFDVGNGPPPSSAFVVSTWDGPDKTQRRGRHCRFHPH